jgi:triosephosphate isomerase
LIADNKTSEAVVCPPAITIPAVKDYIAGSNIKLGAQNMLWEEKGAFTGETSPLMLNALGVEYVIIGHSERRQYFAETDETVNKKVLSALEHGLKPIMCVGETLEEREAGVTDKLVADQVKGGLKDVKDIADVVIAYEPVWAIGTGKTATADEANRVCGIVRKTVEEICGAEAAQAVRIQYGGSMNPGNVAELMAQPEIDGGLIGGAALKAEDFSQLVNNQ